MERGRWKCGWGLGNGKGGTEAGIRRENVGEGEEYDPLCGILSRNRRAPAIWENLGGLSRYSSLVGKKLKDFCNETAKSRESLLSQIIEAPANAASRGQRSPRIAWGSPNKVGCAGFVGGYDFDASNIQGTAWHEVGNAVRAINFIPIIYGAASPAMIHHDAQVVDIDVRFNWASST